MLVPYMASSAWYAGWLKGLSLGMPADEAAGFACCAADVYGKDYARCRITGGNGIILLSESIEGGASRLKKSNRHGALLLSDHGNWRHIHMGALNASYGRTPYYQHFMPLLEEVYNSGEMSLSGFNGMIHSAICRMLCGDDSPEELLWLAGETPRARQRGAEITADVFPELSVIDALMRHGKDTFLALAVMKNRM